MSCRTSKLTFFIWMLSAAFCFILLPLSAKAQRPLYDVAASAGTGLSLGPGDGRTVVMMSPMYIDLDFIYANDERPQFELGVGLQAELQGRVSAGVVPQLRYTSGPGPAMWYGLLGAPLVVAPFALFGIEAGGGFLWRLEPAFGLFGEIVVDYFFLGSDLQDSGVLIQLDCNFGVRVSFR
ncbi:MAG: hypothetical protein JXX14_04605 [Deltaproteobacteria bacterium]|nr:hypothetical protein [Deltaproteobacteria bacterium]